MRMTSGGHRPHRPPREQQPPPYSDCKRVSEDEANWDNTMYELYGNGEQ
jgi:hypothetical protein